MDTQNLYNPLSNTVDEITPFSDHKRFQATGGMVYLGHPKTSLTTIAQKNASLKALWQSIKLLSEAGCEDDKFDEFQSVGVLT